MRSTPGSGIRHLTVVKVWLARSRFRPATDAARVRNYLFFCEGFPDAPCAGGGGWQRGGPTENMRTARADRHEPPACLVVSV
jgi:hypothetical protein